MKELAVVLVFMGFLISLLLVFMYLVFLYIKRRTEQTAQSWSRAAELLGLQYGRESSKKDPIITGQLDDIEINVGITLHTQSVHRPGGSNIRHRAGTRVTATPKQPPAVCVLAKDEKRENWREGWTLWEGGSDAFRQKYQVYLPSEDSPGLAPQIQEAMVASSMDLQAVDGSVQWWRSSIIKDPELIEKAVRECVEVAKLMEASPEKASE